MKEETVILDESSNNMDNLDNDIEELTIDIRKMNKDITNLPIVLNKVILLFDNADYSIVIPYGRKYNTYQIKLPYGCKIYVKYVDKIVELENFTGYIYRICRSCVNINRNGDLISKISLTIQLPFIEHYNQNKKNKNFKNNYKKY